MNISFEVTIGVPVFQSISYIMDTMKSLLNQTFNNIEFLIIDDCGKDGAIDLIKDLQKKHPRGKNIRILVNDSNRGVGYCRNRIIDEAKGRFLYFMDSDDIIEFDTIQKLYDAIISNNAQIAYGSYEIVDRINNSTHIYQKSSIILSGEDELATYAFKYVRNFHVSVCNHLIELSFLRNSGIRFLDVSFWEDMAFTTELVTKVTKAVLLSDITYHYIVHNKSLSHYQDRCAIDKNEILRNISVLDFLKEKCDELICKPYIPYLCYNLEMNSFYSVCYIINNSQKIVPSFTLDEMRSILRHPLPLVKILKFSHSRFNNILFFILGILPLPFFLPSIKLIKKIKA